MITLGICLPVQATYPVFHGVLLDTDTETVIEDPIKLAPNKTHDDAKCAQELMHSLDSTLAGFEIAAAVIYEAGYSKQRGAPPLGSKRRFRLEGVALAVCRQYIPVVRMMDVGAIGAALGGAKGDVLSKASSLGLDKAYLEAAAAALGAKSLS